jgi:hypothetical protein
VFLLGAPLGAKASIIAASLHPSLVAGVVSLSAELFLNGKNVEPFARKLALPALFVTARHDNFSSCATPVLYTACGSTDKKLRWRPIFCVGGSLG